MKRSDPMGHDRSRPRYMSGYRPRSDYVTFNTDLIDIFREWRASGHLEYSFPTRRQAFSFRTRLYRTRLMLLAAREAGDKDAGELYEAAAYMYIEVTPTDEGKNSPKDFWTMRVILDPITRIRGGDELPWNRSKKLFPEPKLSPQQQADMDDAFDKAAREVELRKLKGEQ